jgi:Fur family ferric uptake transcriptional regulator
MSHAHKANSEELLKHHDLKVTSNRKTVLEVFLKKDKVLSLPEISKFVGKDFDRITLYRTLQSFEENGLVHKIPDNNGNLSYALCKHDSVHHNHDDNHVHFICNTCNLTVCLEDVEIPVIRIPKKYKPEKYNFVVEGLCEDCNVRK